MDKFSQSNKFTASFGACFFLNKFGIAVYLGTLMFYHYIHGGLSDFRLFSQRIWDVKWNPISSYLAYRYVQWQGHKQNTPPPLPCCDDLLRCQGKDPTVNPVPYSRDVKADRVNVVFAACLNNVGQATTYLAKACVLF